MKRVVLLGTGTGVGKTHVGAALLRSWRRQGWPAWGLKPVESGLEPEALDSSDAARLGQARHRYAFRQPVSPHLAARLAGVEIEPSELVTWVAEQEQRELSSLTLHDDTRQVLSLVESAGGAFSPLSPGFVCAALVRVLAPAHCIVVAPDALGVLHDVSATLLALAARSVRVDLVVLSASRPPDASTGTNAEELEGVVFPALGTAAPKEARVIVVGRDQSESAELVDVVSDLG